MVLNRASENCHQFLNLIVKFQVNFIQVCRHIVKNWGRVPRMKKGWETGLQQANLDGLKSYWSLNQGILSEPGIAGYKWVPSFLVFNRPLVLWKKYFVFLKTTYSSRYSFVSRHFPCSVFPDWIQIRELPCMSFMGPYETK